MTSLGNLIGPGLSNNDFTGYNPTAMLGEILARVNAETLTSIINKLARSTRIEREPNKWPLLEPEVDLAGNYNLTFKWLGFALEANYCDFLGEEGLVSAIIAHIETANATA